MSKHQFTIIWLNGTHCKCLFSEARIQFLKWIYHILFFIKFLSKLGTSSSGEFFCYSKKKKELSEQQTKHFNLTEVLSFFLPNQ